MKYMLMFCGPTAEEEQRHERMSEEYARVYGRIGEWFQQNHGVMTSAEELFAPSSATTVRLDGGSPVVTDGPFIEAKETIGGFAVVDVPDLDAALALAKTWPGSGPVEVRPVKEQP
jgi:hypothetical protein